MERLVIYTDEIAVIQYISDIESIFIHWIANPSIEQYIRIFTVCLEYQQNCSNPIVNFMSDIKMQGFVGVEARKWFERVALPRAVSQGLKRAAVIYDGSIFKKYYLKIILYASRRHNLALKLFTKEDEALNWISSYYQPS